MLTEAEVLEKLSSFKDAILKLKADRDHCAEEWKKWESQANEERDKYLDLKNKTYLTVKHLVEDNIEPKEEEIADLRKDIESLNDLLSDKDSLVSRLQEKFGINVVQKYSDEYVEGLKKDFQNVIHDKELKNNELNELLNRYNDLEESTKRISGELEKARIENNESQSVINNLRDELAQLKEQQSRKEMDDASAKASYLSAMEKAINDANDALKE